MQVHKYDSREEWLYGRMGKITGSRLKDIVIKRGTDKKIGYYQLIAERLGVPPDGENPMERGSRLESEAIERFKEETGKEVDTSLIIWTRDDNDSIAVSPDGVIDDAEEAIEVKCLSSALHIKAYLTKEVPDEYEMQVLQYFIVNENLQTLHFAFYDPRFVMFFGQTGSKAKLDFFVIKVERKSLEEKIAEFLAYEKQVIEEVNDVVNKLTF